MDSNKTLYPVLDPFQSGFYQVGSLHKIYWEISGKEGGKPVIILHGGPGSGLSRTRNQVFDPSVYMIFQFDQRGCGKSEPAGCLEENTTWDLVSDIELIRKSHNIEKWFIVLGGSWGSCLSLAYAQTHPERVSRLVISGIFLITPLELQNFNKENLIFPEFYEEMISLLPEVEREDAITAYWRRLMSEDFQIQLKYAKAWIKYENLISEFYVNPDPIGKYTDQAIVAKARIETHYFVNRGFMEKIDQLIIDCEKIKNIPTEIIQGRYDLVCPFKWAYEISKNMKNANLVIIPNEGHIGPGILKSLAGATDKFKNDI
jgi:proline iminopeptidase